MRRDQDRLRTSDLESRTSNESLFHKHRERPFDIHHNTFSVFCRDLPSDVVRLNRKFPMTTIDENDQLNRAGTTIVYDSVERRTGGSPRKQDIVNQNDVSPGHIRLDLRSIHTVSRRPIVPIGGDVQFIRMQPDRLILCDSGGQDLGQSRPFLPYPDNLERRCPLVPLDDFVSDPVQNAIDSLGC